MATQLFEGKDHASYYNKYRFSPPQEIQDMIFSYLEEKLQKPYELAVDVGCGTGQSTRMLAPYFESVLGTDISGAQIEQAKKAPGFSNIKYGVCPAEELPVGDASVDLITACAAVHWFNIEKFLKEIDRILKPHGCLAFFTYTPNMDVHYKNKPEVSKVFAEVQDLLAQYQHEKVNHVQTGYKEIFEIIPYTDKKRIADIVIKKPMTVAELIGLIQTFSMYQTFRSREPEKAQDFIKKTEQRFLETMEVMSNETKIELWLNNVLVLASKTE